MFLRRRCEAGNLQVDGAEDGSADEVERDATALWHRGTISGRSSRTSHQAITAVSAPISNSEFESS
jgi:hypothetical protein